MCITVARALVNECPDSGPEEQKVTKGRSHFLDPTEGHDGSGAVAASVFSSCSWGWCPSERNLSSTDSMPVNQTGTVKYALTAPPTTTASYIQVDFSVSTKGHQGAELRLGVAGVAASTQQVEVTGRRSLAMRTSLLTLLKVRLLGLVALVSLLTGLCFSERGCALTSCRWGH